jgi:hypothetical protein
MRRAYAPVPTWFFAAKKGDVNELEKQGFDPNASFVCCWERRVLPLKYVIAMKSVRGVDALLTMGARVTPTLLTYGKKLCNHIDEKQFSYDGNCCLILEMLQHAHDLPPRLCATSWSFAQMSGVWRDLIQPVVEERMSKEEF